MNNMFTAMLATAMAKKPYKRQLSYLESTGTQYINTGVAPDFAGGDEIEIHYYSPSGSGSVCVFGSRQANVQNGICALGGGGVMIADSAGYEVLYIAIGDVRLTVNDSALTANGVSYTMPRRVTCTFPMFLFALNSGGSPVATYNGCQIFEWTYRRNGAVAQHLIPVLDWNDVPCMYDEVSGQCFYNAGSGTFNYA